MAFAAFARKGARMLGFTGISGLLIGVPRRMRRSNLNHRVAAKKSEVRALLFTLRDFRHILSS